MSSAFSNYIRTLAICFLVVTVGNFAINFSMDIYGIFGMPRWNGINNEKLGVDHHARVAKAYSVRQHHPDTVILGSSRAESAFDPKHPYFSGYTAYNLGFPGAAVYEELRYLQHANASRPLRRAVVALDFFQFLGTNQKVAPDFREDRMLVNLSGRSQAYPWGDLFSLTSSGAAFKNSWRTLKNQRKEKSIYREDGYRDDSDDIPQMLRQHGGQHFEFVASEKGYVRVYKRGGSALSNYTLISRSPYQDVEDMLNLAKNNNFELVVVLPPVHVRHLALIDVLGLWPEFEDWKRNLTHLLAEGGGNDHCLIWDFNQITSMTTEEVPVDHSGKVMRWWRESSHATRALGAVVLDVIQADRRESEVGQCLNPMIIRPSLQTQRELLSAWEKENAPTMKELREIVSHAP